MDYFETGDERKAEKEGDVRNMRTESPVFLPELGKPSVQRSRPRSVGVFESPTEPRDQALGI